MRILAFDTATPATAVAICELGCDGPVVEARDDPPPGSRPAHTTRLMPLIAEVLERSDTRWDDLERIAVGTGPGTFTGLRIGIATARALCRARGLPLTGVSTLHSLAFAARAQASVDRAGSVLAAIDARRGELFAAAWTLAELERADPREHKPSLSAAPRSPDALAEALRALGPPVLAIGDGALAFRTVLERFGVLVPADDSELHRVSAASHCRLARFLRGGAPDQVAPEYLRRPDAEVPRHAAGRR